jgi:hypothetical protein
VVGEPDVQVERGRGGRLDVEQLDLRSQPVLEPPCLQGGEQLRDVVDQGARISTSKFL